MDTNFNNMYDPIVAKLGFDPKNYVPELNTYKCDNFESPYDVFTNF